jgi:hypothetical protein
MSAVSKVQCPPCSPKLEEIQMQALPVAHRTLAKLEGKTQLHQIQKEFCLLKPVPHLTVDVDSTGKLILKVTEEARKTFVAEDQKLTNLAQEKANEVYTAAFKLKVAALSLAALANLAIFATSIAFFVTLPASAPAAVVLTLTLIILVSDVCIPAIPLALVELYKSIRSETRCLTQKRDDARIKRQNLLSQELQIINAFFEEEQKKYRIKHTSFARDEETFIPFTDADIVNKNHRMFGEISTKN